MMLPRGFVKIRQYGLLANRFREEKIGLCRQLLLVVATLAILYGAKEEPEPQRRGPDCPRCGGCEWVIVKKWDPEALPPGLSRRGTWDSS